MISRSARTRLILAVLLGATLGNASSALADEASDSYRQGKEALKQGQAMVALGLLEKAARLKPDSDRYQKARYEAEEAVLTQAADVAPKVSTVDYELWKRIAGTCTRIRPQDPRAAAVLAALERLRREYERQIATATSLARAGDIAGAKRLLEPIRSSAADFPALHDVDTEIAWRLRFAEARSALENGDLKTCLDITQSLVDSGIADGEVLKTREQASNNLVDRIAPILVEKERSGSVSDLGFAVFAVREVERQCPLCKGRLGDLTALSARYRTEVAKNLNELQRTTTRSANWARCAVVADASSTLGEDQASSFGGACQLDAPGLKVAVVLNSPPDCPIQDLHQNLGATLPPSSLPIVVSSFAGGVAVDADVGMEVSVERCGASSLGERNLQRRTSTYLAGVQQLTNPEYIQLESRVQRAFAESQAKQRLAAENPGNVGYAWASVAASIGLTSLQNRLRNTPPFVEVPIEQPYSYETFEAGAAAAVQGRVRLFDIQDRALSVSSPVSELTESWGEGVRGVVPNDRTGVQNRDPQVRSVADLSSSTLSGFETKSLAKVRELLPALLTAKASTLLAAGSTTDALGYLAVVRVTADVPEDPDLQRLKNEELKGVFFDPSSAKTIQPLLKVFEQRVRVSDTGSGSSDAGSSGAQDSAMLETSLRAVTLVRRGNGSGTGFFVSADGLVVTNHHVIEGSGPIEVETNLGDSFLATVVQDAPNSDLALLRINGPAPGFLRMASLESASIGAEVFAVGNPRGLKGTVTKGIVSAKRRLEGIRIIQVDVAINPGNSGGPLLLPDGRVVGVNSFKLSGSEGLNFAIAIDEARDLFSGSLGR